MATRPAAGTTARWRARPPRRFAMAELTPHQTPATDQPSPAAPDLLARRGWFAAAAAFGAALVTKLGWPGRAEAAQVPVVYENAPSGAPLNTPGATVLFIARSDFNLAAGNSVLEVDSSKAGLDGIHADGNLDNGVYAVTNSATKVGVLGENRGAGAGVQGQNASGTGVGVLGISTASHGMFGISAAPGGFGGAGNGGGFGLGGFSQVGIGVAGVNVNGANWAGAFFGANQNAPGLYVTGAFVVQGPKSGAVDTAHHGTRLLYAVESPENWFEDFGRARLEAGHAVVELEAIFRETVSAERQYHVFLTPRGDCQGLYVAGQDGHGFEVREL